MSLTQDEIIRMMKEAGFYIGKDDEFHPEWERFAALVAAFEREKQTEQEPVAQYSDIVSDGGLDPRNAAPVRTKDPCHPWQDLTDDEIISALGADMDTDEDKECFIEIVRLGIAAYKEKNK